MKKKNIIILTIFLAVSAYTLPIIYYSNKILPHTYINGISVANLTLEETQENLKKQLEDTYKIKVGEDVINASDIDLTATFNQKNILEQNKRNALLWPTSFFQDYKYKIVPEITFDEEKLKGKILDLNCVLLGLEPTDAHIEFNPSTTLYEIIPDVSGTKSDPEKLLEKLSEEIKEQSSSVNISDCYVEAKLKKDNKALNEGLTNLNKVVKARINYQFGDEVKSLDSSIFHNWIITNDLGKISLDENAISEYVTNLAKETDTAYTARDFKTTSGKIVQVQGPFGYKMNKEAEVERIRKTILAGEQLDTEPEYLSGYGINLTRNGNDYGNSYVEIDLANQKVYLYVNGELIQSSDCVTGNVAKGHTTLPGIFPLTYKEKNAVLRGPGYASPVKYWMPFNGGIGLHDSSWRSNFGGNLYKTNGSHGCVNLPTSMAKTLFDHVEKGFTIICYN